MLKLSKTHYAVTARKQLGYVCFPISSVSVKFLRRYDPLFKGSCCLTYTTFIKSLQYSKAGSSVTTATRLGAGRSETRDWIRGEKRGFYHCYCVRTSLAVNPVSYQMGTWAYFRVGRVDEEGRKPRRLRKKQDRQFFKTCFNYQLDAQFLYSVIYVLH
jgi:hypothetical protein